MQQTEISYDFLKRADSIFKVSLYLLVELPLLIREVDWNELGGFDLKIIILKSIEIMSTRILRGGGIRSLRVLVAGGLH